MKKEIYILAVVIAALFACPSCQKENLPDNSSENGVRIITAEFENKVTKTTLNADGLTPEWAAGDVIRILGSSSYQDVILESSNISDNKITFSTNLTGTLYAVYPASATTLTSCSNGNVTINIPAFQDGTFASANICVAKSAKDDGTNKDNMVFRNATSVLEIKTSSSVIGVDITAANNIAGSVTASFSDFEVSLVTNSLNEKSVSVVCSSAPTDNIFYLATAPVSTGNTTATCYEVNWEGSATRDSKGLQRNVIYSMDLSSVNCATKSDLTGTKGVFFGHEFVIIKAQYNNNKDSYLKWATRNIGAENIKDCGLYFGWGEKVGHPNEKSSSSSATIINAFPSNGVFRDPPAIDGGDQNPSLLPASNDAATISWGAAWKMPTGGMDGQFSALKNATYWAWHPTDKGYYVFAPTGSFTAGGQNLTSLPTGLDIANALLFFPAAGRGSASTLGEFGEQGYYWTRTIKSDDNNKAHCLYFADHAKLSKGGAQSYSSYSRVAGFPIRPVAE